MMQPTRIWGRTSREQRHLWARDLLDELLSSEPIILGEQYRCAITLK